jgi:hypothetical protein
MPERWRHRSESLYRRARCHSSDRWHYKPKGMHWRTVNRRIDHSQAEEDAWVGYGLLRVLGDRF